MKSLILILMAAMLLTACGKDHQGNGLGTGVFNTGATPPTLGTPACNGGDVCIGGH